MKRKERLEIELAASERKVFELRAQLAGRIGRAFDAVTKAEEFMGSAVILQITSLGGDEIVPPVAIRDGISHQTAAAIRNDLRRSFELATIVNPAMAQRE